MTQFMREQLRALISQLGEKHWLENTHYEQRIVKLIRGQLEAILAASPPCTCPTLDGIKIVGSSCPVHGFPSCDLSSPQSLSVKPGWVCKDWDGLNWFGGRPEFSEYDGWGGTSRVALTYADADCVIDPWPDHPNGGPECILEVKP